MSTGIIIGIIIVILIIAFVAHKKSIPAAPPSRVYVFFANADSEGGNIKQDSPNANNPVALKASCDATPGCVAFNTNGWLKSSVLTQDQWGGFSTDMYEMPGMYIVQGTPY